MIYIYPEPSAPIRQGDIFRYLPRSEVLLGQESLPIVFESIDGGSRELDWMQVARSNERILASTFIHPVTGIVITQDCDALRAVNITLCQVSPLSEVVRDYSQNTTPKGFVSIITRHVRINQKWYYLPPDTRIGFDSKMAADFTSVFEVPRTMLEQHRETLRLGRLNDEVAWLHFRERVAEFFRRYPYNDWYPLAAEEVDTYEESHKVRVERYPWQMKA